MVDETIRQLALKNVDAQTHQDAAVSTGMHTLRDDGARKVLAGLTTTAEVLDVTRKDADVACRSSSTGARTPPARQVNGPKDADEPKTLRQMLRKDGVFVTELARCWLAAPPRPRRARATARVARRSRRAARDRSRSLFRARAPGRRRDLHAPARHAAQRGHPARRGAHRAGRAGRTRSSSKRVLTEIRRRSTRAARSPTRWRHTRRSSGSLREHGPRGRGLRHARRGARAAGRLHGGASTRCAPRCRARSSTR